jgi:hypothetical protein
LLALLTVQSAGVLSSGLIVLLTLPFIAGLFDWAENILHLFLLRKTSNFSEPLIFLASTAASIKWSLVIVSVLAIIYHLFM